MKKIIVFVCTILMILSLAACNGNDKKVDNTVSKTSSGVNSAAESGGIVKKESPEKVAPQTASKVPSQKAVNLKNDGSYKVETKKYSFSKDNMNYTASYPELKGNIKNIAQINKAMETCALKTINSIGTSPKAKKTSVKVNCDVTYEGKNFISVGFNEYTKLDGAKKSTHNLRSVNVNLKNGTVVAAKDLIVKNDALYKALENAAKDQLSPDVSKYVTVDVIKAGLDSETINFTKYGAVFCIQITKPEKRHTSLNLTFEQLKQFRSSNDVWSNFI